MHNYKYDWTNVRFTNSEETSIQAGLDRNDGNGVIEVGLNKLKGDSYYDDILKQKIIITKYTTPKATLDDYRVVRNADMDEVDVKKANASRYARMSDANKALVDTWHDDMADSTEDQDIIDAIALIDKDDITALKALLPSKPTIIA